MSRLDEIQKRCKAATPSPWHRSGQGTYIVNFYHGKICQGDAEGYIKNPNTLSDHDFIAHARQDVPALLKIARLAVRVRNACEGTDDIFDVAEEMVRALKEFEDGRDRKER